MLVVDNYIVLQIHEMKCLNCCSDFVTTHNDSTAEIIPAIVVVVIMPLMLLVG